MLRRAVLLATLLLLAACGSAPRRGLDAGLQAAQGERERLLAERPEWRLTGKLAVSGGGQSGSGRVEWQQSDAGAVFELRAPISGRSWRLRLQPGLAELEGLDGGPRQHPDAYVLLEQALGWQLPLAELAHWVRGARAPGPARIEFDDQGLPRLIEQAGWRIEYRSWMAAGEPRLPRTVYAERHEGQLRLVVAQWQ